MDELIKLITKKVGSPEDKAKIAVETVLGFLKEKLPDGRIASQIDGLLQGSSVENLVGGLGSLLGKK
ncbi:MAG: hypothetical protein LLG44_07325 [Chloroflexi bacterium]|nr:hypothetical protein [Chloroflexota bacterium]